MYNYGLLTEEKITPGDAFNEYRVCVIIPTYNNSRTLRKVIEDVALYTSNIIVVNDGSTDDTAGILSGMPQVERVSYAVNKGKGWAIRQGIKRALELGFEYAITIDSDGQHYAKDLPVFIEKMKEYPRAIVIGSRNMNQASVPGKSSFGNRFSNFWFRVETGIKLPDTQSGYRLYPISLLKGIKFFTKKYEFEIEILVRAAWKDIPVLSAPVSVYYAPGDERVSHFRPFKDFFRISVLNTLLVLVSVLYIKPRNFLRDIFIKERRNKFIREHLINIYEPKHIKVFSVAFGVFMGIVPIWGFQLVTAIFLAVLLRLNKALVILAAHISIPPMIPLIIYLSYKTGAVWMHGKGETLAFTYGITFNSVKHNFQQYLYGSITLAVAAALLGGLLTWILLALFRKKKNIAV